LRCVSRSTGAIEVNCDMLALVGDTPTSSLVYAVRLLHLIWPNNQTATKTNNCLLKNLSNGSRREKTSPRSLRHRIASEASRTSLLYIVLSYKLDILNSTNSHLSHSEPFTYFYARSQYHGLDTSLSDDLCSTNALRVLRPRS
jgi:hypothetical protein